MSSPSLPSNSWDFFAESITDIIYTKIVPLDRPTPGSSSASDSGNTAERPKYLFAGEHKLTLAQKSAVREKDGNRCIVTNSDIGQVEIAQLLDGANDGNRDLIKALRGLGIVHSNFQLTDVSNLFLISRDLFDPWDKHAAFIIVPSRDTRREMTRIALEDRKCISELKELEVEPRLLPYPENIKYDILFFRTILLADSQLVFQRRDNPDDEHPTRYIAAWDPKPGGRPGYLIKSGEETHIHELFDINYVTQREGQEQMNPYLVILNAMPKLEFWDRRCIGRFPFDPEFRDAYKECRSIRVLLTLWMHKIVVSSDVDLLNQSCGNSGGDIPEERDEDATKVRRGQPAGEGTNDMPGQISRSALDKIARIERWRNEVSEPVSNVNPD